jgi:aminoglycoside phosphotransferase (APT) family kinase protein
MIRRLHSLPLEGSAVFPNTHAAYRRFLAGQRAGLSERLRAWGSLPERLIVELEPYLPLLDELVDTRRPPHLIHADLTGDHLLGTVENDRWHTSALIDFGDARTGDLLYELSALHMDMFRGDRRLLSAFLDSYGLPVAARAGLPRRALATALLHQFDLFGGITEILNQSPSLEALAQRLFGPPDN